MVSTHSPLPFPTRPSSVAGSRLPRVRRDGVGLEPHTHIYIYIERDYLDPLLTITDTCISVEQTTTTCLYASLYANMCNRDYELELSYC